jgi:hypothetical protein
MGTGVGEAMLIGAVTGAGTSAVMGGDPLKGALLGAVGGGVMPGAGAALQGGTQAATTAGTTAATTAGTQAAGTAATQAAGQSAFQQAVQNQAAQAVGSTAAPMATQAATQAAVKPTMMQGIGNYLAADPTRAAMIGGAAVPMLTPQTSKLSPFAYEPPDKKKYKGPLSRFSYDPSRYTSMARGGLADTAVARRMMGGGHLGSYSDGGRLLKGPGDGMSDDIPAKIGKKQPARLADGEFVVPADVVSGLGNGSTDAGAKKLYAMMDKVRHARTGTKKQGKQINPQKYMP